MNHEAIFDSLEWARVYAGFAKCPVLSLPPWPVSARVTFLMRQVLSVPASAQPPSLPGPPLARELEQLPDATIDPDKPPVSHRAMMRSTPSPNGQPCQLASCNKSRYTPGL